MKVSAILILGAKVHGGAPGRALGRRIAEGAEAAREWADVPVIACGGRAWSGAVEADVIAEALVTGGVDPLRIERERRSRDTIENLREAKRILHHLQATDAPALIVTCAWHLPRALAIAARLDLRVIGRGAPAPDPRPIAPKARLLRERILRAIVPLLVLFALVGLGCRRRAAPTAASTPPDARSEAAPANVGSAWIAADRRDPGSVPESFASDPDPRVRRAAARALSQIADPSAVERLGRSLSDDDREVVAWSAYGLGLGCDVDPDLPRTARSRIVKALVARVPSLEATTGKSAPFDAWEAIAWSLGRCGGIDASRELVRWLSSDDRQRARAAAIALAPIAQRDRGLEEDVVVALLAAARGDRARPPLDEALFPFGRGDWSARPRSAALAAIARARLSNAGRLYALRTFGRAVEGDAPVVDALRSLLEGDDLDEAERIETLRALSRAGPKGFSAIVSFAAKVAPELLDPVQTLSSVRFGAGRVALELLADPAAPRGRAIDARLRAYVGKVGVISDPRSARRIATLRCLAAAAMHPGAPGEGDLLRCAPIDPAAPNRAELEAIRDGARLTALDRGTIVGDKRELLLKLLRTAGLSVRERAFAVFARHAEAGAAPEIVAAALGGADLGLVAAAAQALGERPSIAAGGPSRRAIAEALDPSVDPAKKTEGSETELVIDDRVLAALDGAITRPLAEADGEVKVALGQAIGALGRATARGFLARLCGDRAPSLRRAARLALERLDPPGKAPACSVVEDHGAPAPGVDRPSAAPRRLRLETEAGTFALHLEPSTAPVAVARIAELAAAGFYDGTVVHRVAPGFVVQFGDPRGDGTGGAERALRCETAPVPFDTGDVGIALAGRDTGSSQLFVMLGRAPHLDGSYPRIGRAEGDWSRIAEGDRILTVRESR